jgi:hypothetical protein
MLARYLNTQNFSARQWLVPSPTEGRHYAGIVLTTELHGRARKQGYVFPQMALIGTDIPANLWKSVPVCGRLYIPTDCTDLHGSKEAVLRASYRYCLQIVFKY